MYSIPPKTSTKSFPFFPFHWPSSLFSSRIMNTPTGNHSPTPQPFKTATGHLLRRWAFIRRHPPWQPSWWHHLVMWSWAIYLPLGDTSPWSRNCQVVWGLVHWPKWLFGRVDFCVFESDGNKKKMIQLWGCSHFLALWFWGHLISQYKFVKEEIVFPCFGGWDYHKSSLPT